MEASELLTLYAKRQRDFTGVNLRGADLRFENLSNIILTGAVLTDANIISANMRGAQMENARLERANLWCAMLYRTNLTDANLTDANLWDVDLRLANLSGVIGLPSAAEYVKSNFETTADGVIAYKVFDAQFEPPAHWVIAPGSVITETVNPDRATACGSGVNVATLSWVKENYPKKDAWRVLIRWIDLADIVVPFGTDGKIRAGRVELLGVLK